MPVSLQEWIHKFEEGTGSRIVLRAMILFGMVALVVFYNLAAFHNLANREGMDAAQVARNLADGRGFTTDFIRPLSLHLVYQKATNVISNLEENTESAEATETLWISRLQENHPDLANAPLYPLLLAGMLKANPWGTPDTTQEENFAVYQPDLWIAILNQLLFLICVWLAFTLAHRLFDETVAWVSGIGLMGCEFLWQFTLSGLSTMLLMVIFLALAHRLVHLMFLVQAEEAPSGGTLIREAVLIGLLLGLGALTRYSFGWLVLPVALWIGLLAHPRKGVLASTAVVVFLIVLAPWLTRNVVVSGQAFGTAGYSLFAETTSFPGDDLERSLSPDFREFTASQMMDKFLNNLHDILADQALRLGNSWLWAFFLVGLLVPFKKPGLGMFRYFLLLCLGMFVLVQALGKTAVQEDMNGIHAENLLVLVAPAVFIYGVSLFFSLLSQFTAGNQGIRYLSSGLFCLILAAPLILTLIPPAASRLAYPPYYPPFVQQKAGVTRDGATFMSDIPWAVAWYGQRPCIWLSRNYQEPETIRYRNDFFEVHERIRPVHALYISKKTLDNVKTESLYGWVARTEDEADWEQYVGDWESFLLIGVYLNNEIPTGFPLKSAPLGIFPELFLVDSEQIQVKVIQSQ